MFFEKLLKERQYQLKLTIWSTVLFVIMTVPFISQHKPEILIVSFLLFIVANFFQFKNVEVPDLLRLAMLGGAIFLIKQVLGTFRGLEPGVAFLALLSGIKLFEMKSKRDFFIICLILQLYLVGQLLSEDSIAVVIYIFLATLFLFFMIFCISSDSKSKDIFSLERLKVTIKIFIHAIPLMVILYFVFPRISIGHLFPFAINTNSIVGFTGEVNPGDVSKVAQTDDPVFRVKFNQRPAMSELYFRGSVLNKTKGFSWHKNSIDNTHLYQFREDVKLEYDIFFHDLHMSPLFTLEKTREVIKKSNGRVFEVTGNTWKMVPFNNQKIRYKGIVSSVTVKPLTEKLKEIYLELPLEVSPRVREFSEKLKRSYKTTDDVVASLRTYILKNNFEYTLSPGKYDKKTGLEEFFFERRKGFCEHFAAAIGLILRLTNIPTRMVVGFQGGEYNPVGDYYLVKTKDAHAWLEIYHDERGWERLDPTSWVAPSRINLGATDFSLINNFQDDVSRERFLADRTRNPWLRFKMTLDMMYYELNTRFLEFDYEAQKKLFKKMKFKVRKPIQLISLTFALLTVLLSIYFYFFRNQEKHRKLIDREYDKFLNKLERRGISREIYQGPETIWKNIDSSREDFQAIASILQEYNVLKYSKIKSEEKIKELVVKSRKF